MSFVPKRILIVGGSTRAAAWSALRAGFQPICADVFADADTRRMAQVVPVRDYPRSLPDDIRLSEADGWMFTGALENHPDLIEVIASQPSRFGPVLGCSPAALSFVRDPSWIAQTLQEAGHHFLPVCLENQPPQDGGLWLQKPVRGGGGRLIRVWNPMNACHEFGEKFYFQQFAAGDSMSALFWQDEEQLQFLGATRQLIGSEFAAAPDKFAYCGSVGPISLESRVVSRLTEMARLIANKSGLRGLFGIDFVEDGKTISLVELNPRYTASVEVLERSRGVSILSLYRTWIPGTSSNRLKTAPHLKTGLEVPAVAKVVVYSRKRFQAPDFSEILIEVGLEQKTELADIPVPGTIIESSGPICSVISHGPSISHTLEFARRQVERIQEWLRNSPEVTSVLDRSGYAR